MIHEALRKAAIAYRYYKIVSPEKDYDNEQARKRFDQDKNINLETLQKVIDKIYKEQTELIENPHK